MTITLVTSRKRHMVKIIVLILHSLAVMTLVANPGAFSAAAQ